MKIDFLYLALYLNYKTFYRISFSRLFGLATVGGGGEGRTKYLVK